VPWMEVSRLILVLNRVGSFDDELQDIGFPLFFYLLKPTQYALFCRIAGISCDHPR
jgi:hypothetical protein